MAGKDKNKAGGDDDWDNWDDDYSWDDGIDDEQKDDRKPSTRFAWGAVKGAASDLASVDRMKELAKRGLPKGYGDAIDIVDNTLASTRNLYHDVVREVKPNVRQSKRYLAELSKQYKDKIPSFGKKIVERWEAEAKEEDENNAQSRRWQDEEAQRREQQLLDTVTEALEGTAEQQAQVHADNQARDDIKQDIEDKRFAQTSKQMQVMQEGVSKMVGFNNQYAARYMRKSLELKYRAFALQRAQFDHSKEMTEITLKLLQGIHKNTGLPDIVKANASERLREMAFRKMFGTTLDNLSSFNNRFFGNVKDNIKSRVFGRLQGDVSNITAMLGQAVAGRDSMSMMNGMGSEGDQREFQGQMAGTMLSSFIAPWLVGKGRDKLDKMAAADPTSRLAMMMGQIKDNGANLTYGSRNIGKLLQQDLNEGRHGGAGSGMVKDLLRRGLSLVVDQDHGRRFSVKNMRPDDLIKAAQFDNLTYRSINEVIPGYLAQILRSTEGIRTGQDDPDSHVFDNSTGSFISRQSQVKNAKEQLFNRSQFSGFAGSMSSVLEMADPEKKLSEKARKALAKQLVRDFDANIPYDPRRYTEASNFAEGADKGAIEEIAKFFTERFGFGSEIDDNGNRVKTVANKNQYMRERDAVDLKYNDAGRYQPDIQRQLNLLANTGDREALRKIGILQQKDGVDVVNHDRYFAELDRYIDDPDYVKRAGVDNNVNRAGTRSTDVSIKNRGGKDPKNTAALRDLTDKIDKLGNLNQGGRTEGGEWGYGKWWNEQGVIAGGLEEQARAWQEIQLEAQQEASEQRMEMLHLLQEIAAGGGMGGGEGGEEGEGGPAPQRRGLAGRLFRSPRLRRALSGTGRFLKNRTIGLARFAKNRFISDANRVINVQRWMFSKLTGGVRKLQDIYVKGESQPRLLAAKMRQGSYTDQKSGKTIKSIKDISGPVVDDEGNIVLSGDDLAKGLVDRWGKAVNESGIREWAQEGKDFLGRRLQNLMSIPGAITGLKDMVMKELDKVKDVYVSGETTPRLLALVMNNGGYFRKSDGKPVKHYDDIDGDVVDAQGNVVLTLADMGKGLMDKHGKKLARAGEKIRNLIKSGVMLPFSMMSKAKDLLKSAGTAVRGTLSRMGDWWKNPAGASLGATLTMSDRLEKIYQLLDERMPGGKKDYRDWDNDGIRNGSLEDLRKKREAKEGEKDENGKPKKEDGEKRKGLLGGLMEMLGNTKLGAMFKNGPLGKIIGGLGSGLGGLGTAALGAGQLAWKGTAALGRGALWAGRGALALGSMGMSAVGGLSGLGALLFNPITLGLLAGGLAIWGAWKLYKHFADKPDPMQKMRLYAYGARADDSKFNEKLLKTETYLTEHTKATGGGSYAFDPNMDAQELIKVWEIDMQDRDRMGEWLRWFQERFTPVYTRAYKNWKEQFPEGKKFMEMDKEPDGAAKIQWSEAFIWPDDQPTGPYYVEACPLPSDERDKYLSGPNVKALMQEELKNIKKKYAGQVEKMSHAKQAERWSSMSKEQKKAQAPYALDGQRAVRRFNDMDYKKETAAGRRILDATAVVESISKRGKKRVTGGLIDELTSLRIRIYGLKVPLKSHIVTLLDLEDAVEPSVILESGKAAFKGDLGKLYQEYAAKFGRNPTDENDRKIWIAWMTKRFLPVFVTLVQQTQQYGGNGKIDDVLQNVKDGDRYTIAQALTGATYEDDKKTKVSVWTWASAGFKGLEANTNPTTAQVQMDALKYLADQEKVREKKGAADKAKEDLTEKQQAALMSSAGYQKNADGSWSKKSRSALEGGSAANTWNKQAGVEQGSGRGGFTGYDQSTPAGQGYGIDTGGVSDGGFRKPATGAGPEKGRRLLIKAAIARGITDPKELALLLANVEHESGDYRYSRELSYTNPATLVRVFPKYFPSLQAAQAAISQGPAAVFERVYGGRLGNDKPGDGARYVGRGNIQITGKDNYLRIGKFLGKDLVNNPEYLETPEGAAEGTVAWWMLNQKARAAGQSGDVDASRRAVNGGMNGIQDVRQRAASWMMAAKNGELQKLIDEVKNGSSNATTSASGDAAAPASPGDIKDVGYASSAAGAPTPSGQPAAATPGANPTQRAADMPTGKSAAADAGAPLAATPPVSSMPSNPGAGRGTAPTMNAAQSDALARQSQSTSTPSVDNMSSVLQQQLEQQKLIAANTKNIADKMDDLSNAIKQLNMGQGKDSNPAAATQALQKRPQGTSPTRSRYTN